MKKLTDYLKPNILIIFGALLFIYYLNWLSYGGALLGIGISAIIISAYYLTAGILLVLIGDKLLPKAHKIFNLISVVLFAIFMFVYFLIVTVNAASLMGPTAWIIKILSMAASLALIIIYIVSKFSSESNVIRFAQLVSLVFVLALLLDVLFNLDGEAKVLGSIDVLTVVIYGIYSFYLFSSFEKTGEISNKNEEIEQGKVETEEPVQEETKQEEIKAEEMSENLS